MENLRKKLNVFLIEDNDGDIRLIQEFCELAGGYCITQIAKDGEAAKKHLSLLKTGSATFPDMIILDINLPKISGFEILKEIQEDEILRLIPVIVFSSSLKMEDIDKAYNLGVNVYIEKPMNATAYQEVMEKMWKFWAECVIKVDWSFVKIAEGK